MSLNLKLKKKKEFGSCCFEYEEVKGNPLLLPHCGENNEEQHDGTEGGEGGGGAEELTNPLSPNTNI